MTKQLAPLLLFFVLLFAFAKWGPTIPFSVLTQQKGEPLVVQGEGKVFATPDTAKVSVGIQQTGPTLESTQNTVNSTSQNLVASLKSLGIGEKDIKTTSYNIYPRIDFETPNQRIIGYEVSISYEITIADLDKVNDVLTGVTNAGANVVGGISFEINEKTRKEKIEEARELAVRQAREKAESLASAADLTLGSVINIYENESSPIVPPFQAVDRLTVEGQPAEPDIQPGESEITVTVSLAYEVR